MSNLIRYSDQSSVGEEMCMLPDPEGSWVKFDDVKELLNSSHNKQSTPCVTCGALVPLSTVSCMECINP